MCVRFIGSDIYVDYRGYLKRIAFFQPSVGNTLPCIHLGGTWKRHERTGKSKSHKLMKAEVGGVRKLVTVVKEMTEEGAPSNATIWSWRKCFSLILATSKVRATWGCCRTDCYTLRCRDGRIVVETCVLTSKRSLKAKLSSSVALEAAAERDFGDWTESKKLTYEGLVAEIGSKVEPKVVGCCTDRDIACALYIASSWFSSEGPRAGQIQNYVWGNRHIEMEENSEVIEWKPKSMGVLYMAGWKLESSATACASCELYTPTGRAWGPSNRLLPFRDRQITSEDWDELGFLASRNAR